MFAKLRKRIRAYFLTGLVVVVPVVVSIEVFYWFLLHVDKVLKPFLEDIMGEYFFGIGIALIAAITFVVGMLAQNYVGKKLVALLRAIFDRLPFIRTIYSVVRQLMEPFSQEHGTAFRYPVMVEYPMKGRYAVGFIANTEAGNLDDDPLVTVFLPSNHLHLGYLVIMPKSEVIQLDLSIEETLKLVVSCGIVVSKPLDIRGGKLARSVPDLTVGEVGAQALEQG